jgi:recombination protein RecA
MSIQIASTIDTDLEYISTGIPTFDKVMGGGFARGKITLVSGQPSVGKSTVAYGAIAEAQNMGLSPLLYDVEYAFDAEYSRSIGIDTKKLSVLREQYAEEGLEGVLDAIKSGKYELIVIDSMGALYSRLQEEKSMGEKTIGVQATLTAQFIRKAVPMLSIKNVALVCITHEFTDIMSGKVMASGGAKLMYHSSMHIRLKQKYGVVVKSGDQKIGKVITLEMKKNKLSSTEAKEADAQFLYSEGFSKTADLLESALDKGIITKQGNSYFWGEEKLGMVSKVRLLLKDEKFVERLKEALV